MSEKNIKAAGKNVAAKEILVGKKNDKKLLIFICIFTLFLPMSVSAYQITGVDLHCEAAMLISLDTDDILFEQNAE